MKLLNRRAAFIFLWLFFGLLLLFVDLTIWAQNPHSSAYIFKAFDNTFKDGSRMLVGNLYFLSSEASIEGLVPRDMVNKEGISNMKPYPGIAFKDDGSNLYVSSDFFSEIKIAHTPLKLSDLSYFKDFLLELTPSRKVIESEDSFGNNYRMAAICYSGDIIQLIKLLPRDSEQNVLLEELFLKNLIVNQSLQEDGLLMNHLSKNHLSKNSLLKDTSMSEVVDENVSGQIRMYIGPGPVIEKIELELKKGENLIIIEGRALKRPNK